MQQQASQNEMMMKYKAQLDFTLEPSFPFQEEVIATSTDTSFKNS